MQGQPDLGLTYSFRCLDSQVSTASAPSGCSVAVDGKGTATATWNTAGTAPCASSATKVGQTVSLIQTTIAIELAASGKTAMVRGPKGQYCSANQNNVLKAFKTNTLTDPKALEAALAACEAFCESDAACNVCSVDEVNQKYDRWVALTTCGPIDKWAGAIPGDVSSKGSAGGTATLTMSGPLITRYKSKWRNTISGFEMCFADRIGSQHLWCSGGPNQNTSRIQQ